MDSVEKFLGEAPLKKGTDSAQLHQRLFTTLKTMRDFYHCGGDGLDDKVLDSDDYKVIRRLLLEHRKCIVYHRVVFIYMV